MKDKLINKGWTCFPCSCPGNTGFDCYNNTYPGVTIRTTKRNFKIVKNGHVIVSAHAYELDKKLTENELD